ncbi:MAG: hypothetical protein FJW92_02340 [Actinobacteria bacterium]|nr:hypothetical protein [Actinomycetota bacterium]
MDVHFAHGPDDMATWIASDPGFMQRASHALVAGGRTWLVDPVDHPDVRNRLASLPPVAGVLQLLDRHRRDCAAMAGDLGVSVSVTPQHAVDGAPFEVLVVRDARGWHESALWWADRQALVVAEAVGTSPYFRSRADQVIGPHPFMRVRPPGALEGFSARHVLLGHGHPVHREDAGSLVDAAIAHARGSTPRWMLSLATGSVRRSDRRSPIVTG